MPPLTFLMAADPAGDSNQFYTLARQYFVAAGSTIVDPPSRGQTLEGVFKELKTRNQPQGTINLVSHAFGFAAMQCPVSLTAQAAGAAFMTASDLEEAIKTGSPAPPGPAVITDRTRIVIYGCDIGRSFDFLKMLSDLFGRPGELLAPRRMSIFRLEGTTVRYRQAQTWSLVRKPPLVLGSASTPTGGWTDYRAGFVTDAHLKFGRVAIPDEPIGEDRLKTMLETAAKDATRAFGPSFFFEEGIDIPPRPPLTAAEVAASAVPISNGDPAKAAPKSALQLDDTTVVTTVTGADAYPADPQGNKYQITVTMLAKVLDENVLIAEGPGYRRVTASKGLAPSPGPGGTGSGPGGSGAGTISPELQAIIAELLAGGVPQADIDALLAAIPTGDATEGLPVAVPDVDESLVPESFDYFDPEQEEPV